MKLLNALHLIKKCGTFHMSCVYLMFLSFTVGVERVCGLPLLEPFEEACWQNV